MLHIRSVLKVESLKRVRRPLAVCVQIAASGSTEGERSNETPSHLADLLSELARTGS
jgi:hypothetical protein